MTDLISARQKTFTFEQSIQIEEQSQEPPNQKKVFSHPLLSGIRKYADKAEHVLLVGAPGAGKSATLLRLLVELAKEALQKPESRVPVWVQLKRYQKTILGSEDRSGLLTLIQESLEPDIFLEISEIRKLLFQEKRLFLLLDGLNEMPADTVWTEIVAFRNNCDRAKIPLICTTRELGRDLGIKRRLEIQPLVPREIERFLRECMPGQTERVWHLLGDSNLRATPFVLWMLYDVFQRTGGVPTGLGAAFRQFTRAVIAAKQDAPVSEADQDRWSLLLEHLAFEMLSSPDPKDPGLVISETQAETILIQFPDRQKPTDLTQAHRWLKELLKFPSFLQCDRRGEVSFCHQLLQEYFAAECLLRKLDEYKPDRLSDRQLQKNYLNYLKWTEAIGLMMSLLPDESQTLRVVQLALDVDLFVGARLAGAARSIHHSQTVEKVVCSTDRQMLRVRLLGTTTSEVAVPKLIQTLNDTDPWIRLHVVEALGNLRFKKASNALISALNDENLEVRRMATRALGKFSLEQVMNPLVQALSDEDSWIRSYAVDALSNLPSQHAINSLISALDDENPEVSRRAVKALGNFPPEQSVNPLIQALKHDKAEIQLSAAEELGRFPSEQVINTLINGLLQTVDCRKAEIGLSATVIALGNFPSVQVILIHALKHQDVEVRSSIAKVLRNFPSEQAMAALIQALNDQASEVRCSTALALGNFPSEQAMAALIQALNDQASEVRGLSARALGNFSSSEYAMNALIEALEDENPTVRWSAAAALDNFHSKSAMDALIQALNHKDSGVRGFVAIALSDFSSLDDFPLEQAITALIRALNDVELNNMACRVRPIVTQALGNFSSEQALKTLIQLLSDEDVLVRWSAATALGKFPSEEAMDALIQALNDEDSGVCWRSAKALSNFSSELAMLALIQALNHRNLGVRCSAAKALSKFQSQQAVEALIQLLDDKTSELRTAAVEAFQQMDNPHVLPKLLQLVQDQGRSDLIETIAAIQERYQLYNYEIAQWQTEERIKEQEEWQRIEYKKILSILTDSAKTLERHPNSFQKLDEEALRDHLLVALNGIYEGQATGETFNHGGKTDILVRHRGENVFIGECKFWQGPKKLLDTLDQLLGYTTWRDNQVAILIFNRNQDMSKVVKQIPDVIRTHSSHVQEVSRERAQFRFVVCHPKDQNCLLNLAVLVFDVRSTRSV